MQLEGYALALVAGQWFIGRVKHDNDLVLLDPAYEAHVRWMGDGQGNFGVLREATPIMGSTKLREVVVGGSAGLDSHMFYCDEMTSKERESWSNAIQECEQLIQAIRTAEAGIILAPADAKLIR